MADTPTISGVDLGTFPRSYQHDHLDIVDAEGEILVDADGNEYIDVASGSQNANIGHCRPEIAEAAAEQMREVSYIQMRNTTESVRSLGDSVASFMPEGFNDPWVVSGGSLAVESAIKLARHYHVIRGNDQKYKFITRHGSYHGSTVGAVSATGYKPYREQLEPLLLDFPKAPRGHRYQCELCGGDGGRECGEECARKVEELILEEGPENVAAFMTEPFGGGLSPGERPHPGYLETVREICDEYDVLFIMDEILTGIGRTGADVATDHYDFTPDVILTGKGITAGYAPAGVVTPHDRIAEEFHDVPGGFIHGHTNTFHPVTAAIGDAVLNYTRREGLVDNAATVGDYLLDRLEDLYDYDAVGDVRGHGLLCGVEFVADRETRRPFDIGYELREALGEAGREHGLLLVADGGHLEGGRGDFLVIAPPLTTSKSRADDIVDRLYPAVGDALERCGIGGQ